MSDFKDRLLQIQVGKCQKVYECCRCNVLTIKEFKTTKGKKYKKKNTNKWMIATCNLTAAVARVAGNRQLYIEMNGIV